MLVLYSFTIYSRVHVIECGSDQPGFYPSHCFSQEKKCNWGELSPQAHWMKLRIMHYCMLYVVTALYVVQPKSFLRVLVEGFRSKNLTDAEIVSLCVIFLLAGYETIASTLAHTCYVLALNNLLQEKLCATIDAYFKRKPVSYVHA